MEGKWFAWYNKNELSVLTKPKTGCSCCTVLQHLGYKHYLSFNGPSLNIWDTNIVLSVDGHQIAAVLFLLGWLMVSWSFQVVFKWSRLASSSVQWCDLSGVLLAHCRPNKDFFACFWPACLIWQHIAYLCISSSKDHNVFFVHLRGSASVSVLFFLCLSKVNARRWTALTFSFQVAVHSFTWLQPNSFLFPCFEGPIGPTMFVKVCIFWTHRGLLKLSYFCPSVCCFFLFSLHWKVSCLLMYACKKRREEEEKKRRDMRRERKEEKCKNSWF